METKNAPPETPVDLPAVPSLIEVRQLAHELDIQKARARALNDQHEQAIQDLVHAKELFLERLESAKKAQAAAEAERSQLTKHLADADAKLQATITEYGTRYDDLEMASEQNARAAQTAFEEKLAGYEARFRTLEANAVSQADAVEARVDRAIGQITLLRAGGAK